MLHYLVVIKPFLHYVRGDVITDKSRVSDILAGEYKRFATKVAAPNTFEG